MESTAHPDTGHTQHATPKTYYIVYGCLVVLMVMTVVIAKIPLGPLNNVAAMAIAVTKATLVVLFFMQVRYSTKLTWVWASLGFIWLFLLFGIMGDYITRAVLAASGWNVK